MKHVEGQFTGIRGYNLYYQGWLPDGKITASVQVAHGIVEHSGRYMNVVNTLVPNGIAVYANDHRGHGKSDGPINFVEKFNDYIEDQRLFRSKISEENPAVDDCPRFLLGHSMGSIICAIYASKYPDDFNGLILSGFGLEMKTEASPILIGLSKLISKLAPKTMIDPKIDPNFISRDQEAIDAYVNDPLVRHEKITARLGAELLKASKLIPKIVPEIKIPVLVQVGSEDTSMGGFNRFNDAFSGTNDKTFKIYEGLRHEVYNELEEDRKKVLQDLLEWIKSHL
ncbi:MAG: lysophospholipase [Promethearchaeota archaeon]